jgi:hypothetical protein
VRQIRSWLSSCCILDIKEHKWVKLDPEEIKFSVKLILVLIGLISLFYSLNITSDFPKQFVWHIHVSLKGMKFMVDTLFCAHLSVTAFRMNWHFLWWKKCKTIRAQTVVTYYYYSCEVYNTISCHNKWSNLRFLFIASIFENGGQ